MELFSWISQKFSVIPDALAEQPWFQQLKAKWEELDLQTRFYFKIGFIGVTVLGVLGSLSYFVSSVYKVRSEYNDKLELVRYMQSSNEELDKLKKLTASPSSAGLSNTAPWAAHIEGIATGAGIDRPSLTISPEKPGEKSTETKEALIDVTTKHLTLRQLIRFAFALENNNRPMKIRNLQVDTKGDPSGYMDATFYVSGFSAIPAK